jgi:hypothetical protein
MRRLVILLVFCFAALAPARGQTLFVDDNAASHWMTYYYVDKDTEHVGAFLPWVAGFDFAKKTDVSPPVTGFLAALFAANPDKVRGWLKDVQPNEGAKTVLERALWLSGHADLIAELFRDAPDYAKGKPTPLMELALDTPGSWDMMWAAFSATGDTRYPARLIDLLDDSRTFTGNEAVDALYHRTVAWSLASNMSQHELILRMVRREAGQRSGPVQQKLKDMLAKVEAQRVAMPDCDGDFCAILALISEENLKELDKPYDQGPVLKELSDAKVGDHVAVVFTFAGMALAEDLSGDVRYDLKIIRPDGAIYDGSEHKDVPALKGKVPMRFSIFDNRPMIVVIRFEPQDPRGTYRVEAVMRDKIGGKTVKLVKEITLKD